MENVLGNAEESTLVEEGSVREKGRGVVKSHASPHIGPYASSHVDLKAEMKDVSTFIDQNLLISRQ